MIRLLRARPRFIIKKVLALVQLSFLQHYFDLHLPPELAQFCEEFGPPEDMASAGSILVAIANNHHPLDSWDFALPTIGSLVDRDLQDLLRYGAALSNRYEVGKHISLFGYRLECHGVDERVFYLRPSSLAFEYSSRLGFIRAEMGSARIPLEVNKLKEFPEVSLRNAARAFAHGHRDHIAQIADDNTPFRRVRLNFPLAPGLYKFITEGSFYGDATVRETLGQDFLFPLKTSPEEEVQLTETLTLRTFLRIWKLLLFFSEVDICLIEDHYRRDPMLLFNSLVRVTSPDDLVQMIGTLGEGEEQAREFIRLVAGDVRHLGYYDLQYRPLLQIATATVRNITSRSEIIQCSTLIALSNILRNVQIANQIRLRSN